MPTLTALTPSSGPVSGGDLVELTGTEFAEQVRVFFAQAEATVEVVRTDGSTAVALVRTPAHADGRVDVTLENLDASGAPVAGERATLAQAYRFLRHRIAGEADLTRLVRTLLRELKRQVLENTALSTAADFDDTPLDGLNVVALAELPALTLSGPRLRESRFYATNELREEVVTGTLGPELRRRRPAFTVDVEFLVTGASNRALELLNLITALVTFLNRNTYLAMLRDESDPSLGSVRWELAPSGELRTNVDGKDDVRAFTWGLVIRGFDVEETLVVDAAGRVDETNLELVRKQRRRGTL